MEGQSLLGCLGVLHPYSSVLPTPSPAPRRCHTHVGKAELGASCRACFLLPSLFLIALAAKDP